MKTVYELSDPNIEELFALYQKEWWTKGRSFQETKVCVAGSQINIGILNNEGRLVGYGRVLTDYIFKALIFDIIVCESQRGKGLGDRLLKEIKGHPQLASVKTFELYCLPEMLAFYQRHGFSADVGDIKLMKHTASH